jgi:PAS domain S-box-containing protein
MDDRLIKVLLIEDDLRYAWLVREMLSTERGALIQLECASELSTGLDRLAMGGVDVILLDLSLQDSRGFDTFARVQGQAPDVPVIVLTQLDDQALAMKTIRRGAQDYLVKGRVDGDQLVCAMRYAIERKRMEQVLAQQYHELALLNRAIQAFSSTLDLNQVLATVLEEVRRLLDVVACSIWLIEPETGDLVCRQAAGRKSEVVQGWRLSAGEGIVGWVAGYGESLVVPDALMDERHFVGIDQVTGLRLRSILTVPLQVRERVIGVLQVLDSEANRFSSADLMLLEPLATAAAAALENARLYEEAEKLRAFNEKIVQSMEEGILLEDAAGCITFVNAKAAELVGYAPEELVGKHRMDILVPEYLAAVERESAKWAQGVSTRYDVELLVKDGQRVPVIVSARPMLNDGRLTGVLSVLIDVTAREHKGEG